MKKQITIQSIYHEKMYNVHDVISHRMTYAAQCVHVCVAVPITAVYSGDRCAHIERSIYTRPDVIYDLVIAQKMKVKWPSGLISHRFFVSLENN